ncbi:Glycosyl transferase family 2 [Agromyces sp. CF514]|uniref:glycosyltransferase family 2 protein n=1 Tax=Agromyces sp. CF514 TaxID=1881031 RepID=UPI0008EF3026|nr:glycosyltransferase family A protein [Agromyces sp. CF514]SFR72300.1 Glycosyl transferase family 2 [Agromyces sp. CF514]
MPTPRDLAVIVCTRNRATMLGAALESILASVPRDVEVLVVDSASDDLATRDAATASGASYVRSDVKGLSIARDLGLRTSTRPLVLFTDDDCVAVTGWIDPVLEHFADPQVGAVTGRMLDHTLIGTESGALPKRFTRTVQGIDAGHGAVMAFRRELVLDLGGFDPVLGAGRTLAGAEDLDMFCRILDAGHAIVHDPSCTIHHMNTRQGESYTELHHGYGLGLGALANKLLRLRFRVGLATLAVLLKRTGGRALRHLRDPRHGKADRAMLRGIARGFLAGAGMRLDGSTFVDEHPPTATPLDADVGPPLESALESALDAPIDRDPRRTR